MHTIKKKNAVWNFMRLCFLVPPVPIQLFLFFNMQPGFFPVMSLHQQINILETELYKLGMRKMYSKTDKDKNMLALIPFTRRIY